MTSETVGAAKDSLVNLPLGAHKFMNSLHIERASRNVGKAFRLREPLVRISSKHAHLIKFLDGVITGGLTHPVDFLDADAHGSSYIGHNTYIFILEALRQILLRKLIRHVVIEVDTGHLQHICLFAFYSLAFVVLCKSFGSCKLVQLIPAGFQAGAHLLVCFLAQRIIYAGVFANINALGIYAHTFNNKVKDF